MTLTSCLKRQASDDSSRQLLVFNWSDYIADELIAEFETRANCTVIYDNYSSDAELETRLATGGGSYDLVFPSDRAMWSLLGKGLLQEIDRSRLTNFLHLDRRFLTPPFDPTNRYSVPYFWGTLAVGIRAHRIPQGAEGFEILFDPQYRGRITMLDDMENVVAAAMLQLGFPLNSVEADHLAQARELLVAQKRLVQAYTSDSYRERLLTGQAWAALGWNGDLQQAAAENDDIHVVIPKSGTLIWLDSMVIPKAARHVELAHAFIDFLLEPAIAARNAVARQYPSPNIAAREQLPQAMREDQVIYPPAELLDRCDWLRNRGRDIEKIEAVWRAVRA